MKRVRLMAATVKGLFMFESDDRRKDWKLTPCMPGWEVYSVFAEAGGKRVYAGTSHYAYGPSVRISDDSGATWLQQEGRPVYPPETGFKLNRIWQITAGHPSESGTLFAGVDEAGLFVSRDRGITWSEVESLTRQPSRKEWFPGAGGLCLHTILIDPNNKNRMWVGISAVGVFRTTDAGASWTPCNNGLASLPTGSEEPQAVFCVHKIVLDPRHDNTLYMQYHGGVFRSTDGADSWQRIEHGLPGNFGFPMVITRNGNLFIAPLKSESERVMRDGKFCIYRSTDNGAQWQPMSNGLPGDPQFVGVLRDAMTVDSLDQQGVYVGTSMGELYCSTDQGEEWSRLPGTLPRITNIKTCLME